MLVGWSHGKVPITFVFTSVSLLFHRLAASIQFQRHELIASHSHPIPLNPPPGYFPSNYPFSFGFINIFLTDIQGHELPGVGELMAASFPIDNKFANSISQNDWYEESLMMQLTYLT
jgi:hypothetical protein